MMASEEAKAEDSQHEVRQPATVAAELEAAMLRLYGKALSSVQKV